MRLSGDTPVKEDTQAKLTLAGVTGNSFIQLSGGTPQSSELKGKDGKLPIIIASPSPISRLLNDSSDLVTNINLLLHNANQMFSESNVEHLSNTLANLDQTTGAFASKKGGIADTLAQLSEVGRQANATLAETQALMKNANGLLGSQGKQAIGSAEQAMQSLAESAATLNSLLQDNRQSIDDGAQGLNQVAPAIRELRETLNSLKGYLPAPGGRPQRLPAGPRQQQGVPAMTRSLRLAALTATLSLASACSILPQSAPVDIYRLPASQATGNAAPVGWSLRLNKPLASEALAGPRIAVIPRVT